MIRKYFINKLGHNQKENIRWRSHEVSRIEAFSDAVFAFAVSLLVISLEVPKSSKELIEMMEGFFPFIFCFAAIFWVWRTQYKFFRRYGMHDNVTIGLNGVLLFVVLFFVYPLKFLFSSMIMPDRYLMSTEDFATMTIIYNSAAAALYTLFMLMYVNAYTKRKELVLTDREIFETVTFIYNHAGMIIVGSSVAVIAVIGKALHNTQVINSSFMAYGLAGVIMPWIGANRKKAFKKRFGKVLMDEPHLSVEA